jgi:folate-dependent phosphoribosylglycinamide formyltransferase PurN
MEKQAALDRLVLPPAAESRLPAGIPSSLPKKLPLVATRSQPRVVLYASTISDKVRRMVTAWSQWGFRPAAVVVERWPERSITRRLQEKLRDEGLDGLARRVWRRARYSNSALVQPSVKTASRESTVEYCRSAGIPAIEVGPLDSKQAVDAVRALAPDLAIHAGAGILRSAILDVPRLGTLNAHMGILPRYRGMNVAEWSRLQGDVVGCTVHLIDEGIDTGDIICCRAVSVGGVRSIAELRSAVDQAQIELLGEVVQYVVSSNSLPPRRAQTSGEGHQYFVMHPDLVERLEKGLHSSLA